MFKFSDVIGTLMQAGLSQTSTQRLQNALGSGGEVSGGASGGLSQLLGGTGGRGDALSGLFGGGRSGGGIGGMLQGVLGDAGRLLGDNKKLALGGLGALAGSILGGGGDSVKGALGGGLMAMLGAMAFSALKGAGQTPQKVPLGLRQPEDSQQEEQLEQQAELVLKAMINAAKADGQIDQAEVQRIIGKLEGAGANREARNFVLAEMNKPMDLEGIVAAAKGNPQLGAELYAASLLTIKVDTPAERTYMQQLAGGLGLTQETVAHLEQTVGMA